MSCWCYNYVVQEWCEFSYWIENFNGFQQPSWHFSQNWIWGLIPLRFEEKGSCAWNCFFFFIHTYSKNLLVSGLGSYKVFYFKLISYKYFCFLKNLVVMRYQEFATRMLSVRTTLKNRSMSVNVMMGTVVMELPVKRWK